MKRQRKNCLKCYNYEPHFHPKRLLKAPPKTSGDEFIFFPSSGDLAFAPATVVQAHIDYANKYPDRDFLIQSKAPKFFIDWKFPENVILAITLETNRRYFYTSSLFKTYEQISKAPVPIFRFGDFDAVKHRRKIVTVEPILDFDSHLLSTWISRIDPQIVYVGYDNHNSKLPEPSLAKTKLLIQGLQRFTKVRVKTLRKAWWE